MFHAQGARGLASAASVFAAFAATHPAAHAQLSSSFDSSAEGWVVADLEPNDWRVLRIYEPWWTPTAGNPGGAILYLDPSSNTYVFSAPPAYLGDKLAYLGGTLEWDLRNTLVDTSGPFRSAFLVRGFTVLTYDTPAPATTWTAFSVPITHTGWRVAGGPPVSPAQFEHVLSGLTGLYILADWSDSADDVAYLDNVRFLPGGGVFITQQPAALQAVSGSTAEFSVVANGPQPLSYTWRRNGLPLSDGPAPGGGTITGAGSPTLRIQPVRAADAAASFDVVVASGPDQAASAAVALVVYCSTDWTRNSAVNSGDVTAFLADWFGDLAFGTLNANFNGDSLVNSGDVTAFLIGWFDQVVNGC